MPSWLSPRLALAHAEARTNDLAQPRPEYCHATNALAFVGRRSRTRGLFLDRRAFLISYDPVQDADGAVLTRLLDAIVPVTAGINLEYYFGSVDPVGYGCDTKLPHNISALLGVMDGSSSDLRTGLPIQTLELHEPVRQLMVVEAPPARVRAAVEASASLKQLFDHRWVLLFTLEPDGDQLHTWRDGAFHPFEARPTTIPVAASSDAVYHGLRTHLPITAVAARRKEVTP